MLDGVVLLKELKAFTERSVQDLILPVRLQEGDQEQTFRAAEVYQMRLPNSHSAKKKAPYILHQLTLGTDEQLPGERDESVVRVRTIFCVYNEDEQEGALMLLNLMERLRISLLRQVVIGHQFTLKKNEKIERQIYYEDTAPYYAGEMQTVWEMPSIQREVCPWNPNPRP